MSTLAKTVAPSDHVELPAKPVELPVRVYSPEPAIQHPAILIKDLIRDVLAGRELARQHVVNADETFGMAIHPKATQP